MMYRNKINFTQPLRPSNRPSPPFETNSFHARGVSVEYEYGGNERPERETIFDRALDVYRHVHLKRGAQREIRWYLGGRRETDVRLELPGAKRGDDSRCRYVTTISVNNGRLDRNPTPCGGGRDKGR